MFNILRIALLTLCISACAQTPTNDYEQANHSDVESALKNYHHSQSALSAKSMTSHFNYPLTLILGEGVTLVVEKKDSMEFFIPVVAYLDHRNLQHSQWNELSIKSLGENLAIASAKVSQVDSEGNIIDRFSEIYTLSKKGKQWKISSITRFSANQYVSL